MRLLPFSIQNELPIRVSRYRLDPVKADEFNFGTNKDGTPKFARNNYRWLYELRIDKGEGKTYIQLATTDFKQLLYSIKVLWNSYDGKPYDRHGHPVVMQAYDIDRTPMEAAEQNPKRREELVGDFRKTYSKHKS